MPQKKKKLTEIEKIDLANRERIARERPELYLPYQAGNYVEEPQEPKPAPWWVWLLVAVPAMPFVIALLNIPIVLIVLAFWLTVVSVVAIGFRYPLSTFFFVRLFFHLFLRR